jgi:hypothetical protein
MISRLFNVVLPVGINMIEDSKEFIYKIRELALNPLFYDFLTNILLQFCKLISDCVTI